MDRERAQAQGNRLDDRRRAVDSTRQTHDAVVALPASLILDSSHKEVELRLPLYRVLEELDACTCEELAAVVASNVMSRAVESITHLVHTCVMRAPSVPRWPSHPGS